MSRPSRAKMCNFLSGELINIRVIPSNPADIQAITTYARLAESKVRDLGLIAAELGWHVDADLETAWELIQTYEKKYAPKRAIIDPTVN